MNTTENPTLNPVNFNEYILRLADEYGFGEPTRTSWITTMTGDIARGKSLIEEILGNYGQPSSGMERALDVGCGFGGMANALSSKFNESAGIEIVEDRAQWAAVRAASADIAHGSATALPWPQDHFDFIISIDVFEHISFEQQMIAAREMARTMKPGGFGYVQVPNRFQLMDAHNHVLFATYLPERLRRKYVEKLGKNKNYLHCWERTGHGWKRLFSEAGFKVTLMPMDRYRSIPILPATQWKILLAK